MPRKTKQESKAKLAEPKPKRGPYRKAVVVNTEADRCPKCKSTNREGYVAIRTTEVGGTFQGKPFTSVTHKRTRCRDCGQARVAIFRYFDPKKAGE